MFCRHTDACS
jgi:17beta-estradiol 17-dehydrogenase / very-long-chain 3-oxoacyl-CoA reductase